MDREHSATNVVNSVTAENITQDFIHKQECFILFNTLLYHSTHWGQFQSYGYSWLQVIVGSIMAWHLTGNKKLAEPRTTQFTATYIHHQTSMNLNQTHDYGHRQVALYQVRHRLLYQAECFIYIYIWKACDNFIAEVKSTGYYHSISIKTATDIHKVNRDRCHDSLPHTLQWRHNERDGVSNHRHIGCLLNSLFRRRSKFHVTGLCEGNSPVAGEFPTQKASNTENVSIRWCHHDFGIIQDGARALIQYKDVILPLGRKDSH